MRPGGKDGILYKVTFGTVKVGGAAVTIETAGWYKIKTKASASSGFPAKAASATGDNQRDLAVGDVYYAKATQSLAEGDSVIPMTLKRLSFVTDISDQSQGQTFDVTTQDDIETGEKSFISGAFKERSGTINGFVDVDSDEQRELVNEYRKVIVDDGTNVTVNDAASVDHEYMLSKREFASSGEIEVWEYLPVVSESINTSKPLDGAQPFSFNYKVDGQRKPCSYYRTVA